MTVANASNPNVTTVFNDIFIDNDKNSTNTSINNTSSNLTHLDCNETVDTSHNQTQIMKNTTKNIIETGGLKESKLNRSPSTFQKIKVFTDSKNNIEVNKPKGHFKNSLKRKRRSNYIRAPLIVNYETLHTPETNNDNLHSIYTPLPNSLAQQTKEKGVANFVIETLHDPSTSEEEAYKYKRRDENVAPFIQDSSKDVRKENSNETRSSYKGYNENEKKITPNKRLNNSYNNEEEPLDHSTNDELKSNLKEHDNDDSYPLKSYKGRIVVDSEQISDFNNSRSNSAESLENTFNSGEKLQKPHDQNGEIKDKIETTQDEDDTNNSNESKYNSNESIESSLEDNEEKPFPTVSENSANLILSTPATIQEVDLGDFSYERIRVKDNREVITVEDNNESSETDGQLTNLNAKPQTHIDNSPLKYFSEPNYKEEFGKQIKINVGEIKPVVEINDEDLSEEKGDKLNDNFSFESLPFNTDITHEKQVNNVKNNNNVKQQFERIPLDYKHEKKNQESDEQVNPVALSQNDELDKNLNIKFGDISLDLPDIKLPDNILDVNNKRSDSDDNNDDNEKPSNSAESHSNEDDVSNEGDDEEDDNVENGNNYDNYNKYSGNYYNAKEDNSDEKKESDDDAEEEEEEEEDLYEKFVRERFGKQGSFKSRYEPDKQFERFRQKPINPELRDTLKQILNKTKTTSKQAEKSNDPNAGYMWTLEYGEQL